MGSFLKIPAVREKILGEFGEFPNFSTDLAVRKPSSSFLINSIGEQLGSLVASIKSAILVKLECLRQKLMKISKLKMYSPNPKEPDRAILELTKYLHSVQFNEHLRTASQYVIKYLKLLRSLGLSITQSAYLSEINESISCHSSFYL